jgi:hypothetical protein
MIVFVTVQGFELKPSCLLGTLSSCLVGRVGTSGRREVAKKWGRGVNMVHFHKYMHVNAKVIPVETVP